MTTSTLSPCGLVSLLSVLSPRWIASRSTAGVTRREVPQKLENLPQPMSGRLSPAFHPIGLICTCETVPSVFHPQTDGPL
jgi:hypothetical protein